MRNHLAEKHLTYRLSRKHFFIRPGETEAMRSVFFGIEEGGGCILNCGFDDGGKLLIFQELADGICQSLIYLLCFGDDVAGRGVSGDFEAGLLHILLEDGLV